MSASKRKRGEPPTRVDFSTFQPPGYFVDNQEWEREQARHAAQQAAYARQRNLERQPELRLTDDVQRAIIRGEGLRDTKALDIVRRWYRFANAKPTLIAHGNPGCGKSVAGAWLVAECGGVWLRAERARRAYVSTFGAELERLTDALGAPMLVLEDVGTEQDAVSFGALLCEVLEQRKAERHRTLITTNLTPPQWTKRYGDPRIASRAGAKDVLTESVYWRNVADRDLRIVGSTSGAAKERKP
jgi:DNA replication protein DnaC